MKRNSVWILAAYAVLACAGCNNATDDDSDEVVIENNVLKEVKTSKSSFTIPDGVTSIGEYAFYMCTSLTSVDIPDSVTSIEWSAFFGCTSLTSVDIPDSVTTIESFVFHGCTSLTNITIPVSVTSIESSTFYGCTSLTDIKYNGTKDEWNKIKGISSSGLFSKKITGKDGSTWTAR